MSLSLATHFDERPVRDANATIHAFDPDVAWRFSDPHLLADALAAGALAAAPALLLDARAAAAIARCEHAPLEHLRALWLEDTVVSIDALAPALQTLCIECHSDGTRIDRASRSAPLRAKALRSLAIDTWGLTRATLAWVCAADAPALTTLHLGLGAPEYGADHGVEDLAPLLAGGRFPALRELGLHYADINRLHANLLHALSSAPLLQRLATLDMSACWFEGTQHELDLRALGALEVRWGDAWPGPDESLRYIPTIE